MQSSASWNRSWASDHSVGGTSSSNFTNRFRLRRPSSSTFVASALSTEPLGEGRAVSLSQMPPKRAMMGAISSR